MNASTQDRLLITMIVSNCCRRMTRKPSQICCALLLAFVLVAAAIIVYEYCIKPSILMYRIVDEHIENYQPDPEGRKIILLYTKFFNEPKWELKEETVGPEYLAGLQCPITNCVITSNHKLLEDISEYDALLFHIAESWNKAQVPEIRSPHQIYIAATMESPANTKHNLARDHDFFNWTMTYRLDSDVVWPYSNVVETETGIVRGPNIAPQWRQNGFNDYYNVSLLQLAEGKTKGAVQFVSHCGALSRRDDLTGAIQRLMEVDVYGKCGTKDCPRFSSRCTEMLNHDYRFYLSFENSLCRDYVTEKLYEYMKSFIVPVVFGGADYARFAPPGSYIDAQKFPNVSSLVDYLNYLTENPIEYIKYFWWKEYYSIEESRHYCEVCRKLNEVGSQYSRQSYSNLKSWWYDSACQRDSKIKF